MNNEKDSHKNSNIHDLAFKDFLGVGENCFEFLKAFLPQGVLEQLYLITLILIKGEFVNLYNQKMLMDILVKIKMKDDKENQYMYIILEHKSAVDASIIPQNNKLRQSQNARTVEVANLPGNRRPCKCYAACQISQYIGCIMKHQKDNDEKLQPIYSVVFYHGEEKWNTPTSTPKGIVGYANVSYQLIDTNRMDANQLDTTDDIKSMVYIFQNIRQFSNLEKVRKLIQQLVKFSFFQYSKNKKNALRSKEILFYYIMSSIPVENRETVYNIFLKKSREESGGNMVESLVDAFRDIVAKTERKEGIQEGIQRGMQKGMLKGREEGIQKGVLKGREEGMQETALKMKQEGATLEFIQKVTGLATEKIEKL